MSDVKPPRNTQLAKIDDPESFITMIIQLVTTVLRLIFSFT